VALNEGPVKDNNGHHPFDLEERTAKFGEAMVRFQREYHAIRATIV